MTFRPNLTQTQTIAGTPAVATFTGTLSGVVDDGTASGGRVTEAQRLAWQLANDGSADLAQAPLLGAIPSGLLLFGIQSDGTLVRVPASLVRSG